MSYVPQLMETYRKDIVEHMMKKFNYKNVMEVPSIQKITLNMGVGAAVQDPKQLEVAVEELTLIAGQRAAFTQAKNAISNFKLREGMKIGCKATIRGKRMYDFLFRFINLTAPRIRDFRGLSPKSFDGRGSYSCGIKEHIVFAEINMDKVNRIRGLNVNIVTNAKTDAEAFELLKAFGFPFKK